ncbi:hypothetical protein IG631_20194 [Alternaria alternata]|nr:hypothetical protein IG631_20194 [Alternaria alternata]
MVLRPSETGGKAQYMIHGFTYVDGVRHGERADTDSMTFNIQLSNLMAQHNIYVDSDNLQIDMHSITVVKCGWVALIWRLHTCTDVVAQQFAGKLQPVVSLAAPFRHSHYLTTSQKAGESCSSPTNRSSQASSSQPPRAHLSSVSIHQRSRTSCLLLSA